MSMDLQNWSCLVYVDRYQLARTGHGFVWTKTLRNSVEVPAILAAVVCREHVSWQHNQCCCSALFWSLNVFERERTWWAKMENCWPGLLSIYFASFLCSTKHVECNSRPDPFPKSCRINTLTVHPAVAASNTGIGWRQCFKSCLVFFVADPIGEWGIVLRLLRQDRRQAMVARKVKLEILLSKQGYARIMWSVTSCCAAKGVLQSVQSYSSLQSR